MLLLIAGYGLAAAAFYAYIYLTAQPDPHERSSTPTSERHEALLPPAAELPEADPEGDPTLLQAVC